MRTSINRVVPFKTHICAVFLLLSDTAYLLFVEHIQIRKTQHFGCQHKVWSTERRQEIFQGEAHHCFSLADRCTTPIFGCFQPRRRGVDMRPYRSLSAPFVVYVAAVTARVMRDLLNRCAG